MTPETPTPETDADYKEAQDFERSALVEPLEKFLKLERERNAAMAEIEAMREAITSSYHMLKYFERFMPNLVDFTEQQWLNTQEGKNTMSALAKLEPFIPDATPTKP